MTEFVSYKLYLKHIENKPSDVSDEHWYFLLRKYGVFLNSCGFGKRIIYSLSKKSLKKVLNVNVNSTYVSVA